MRFQILKRKRRAFPIDKDWEFWQKEIKETLDIHELHQIFKWTSALTMKPKWVEDWLESFAFEDISKLMACNHREKRRRAFEIAVLSVEASNSSHFMMQGLLSYVSLMNQTPNDLMDWWSQIKSTHYSEFCLPSYTNRDVVCMTLAVKLYLLLFIQHAERSPENADEREFKYLNQKLLQELNQALHFPSIHQIHQWVFDLFGDHDSHLLKILLLFSKSGLLCPIRLFFMLLHFVGFDSAAILDFILDDAELARDYFLMGLKALSEDALSSRKIAVELSNMDEEYDYWEELLQVLNLLVDSNHLIRQEKDLWASLTTVRDALNGRGGMDGCLD